MKIISHRGNIDGPREKKENRPSYIDCAMNLGYDVEVDIRYENNNFWLGHDTPDYKIEHTWMNLRKEKLWFHCKDLLSCIKLLEIGINFKYFCHTNDDFVLTSTNHIWVNDLSDIINDKCIIPLLDKKSTLDQKNHKIYNPYAVCTDYPRLIV